jgi:hypothetical protein
VFAPQGRDYRLLPFGVFFQPNSFAFFRGFYGGVLLIF